jgi:CyaY protein
MAAETKIRIGLNMVKLYLDLDYLDQAEALLKAVEACCDRLNDDLDADIDNQRVGSMVTLTFANRSQIVINLQKPLQEIWMAAKAGGYHYRLVDGQWLDTKGHGELLAELSRQASTQSSKALQFVA